MSLQVKLIILQSPVSCLLNRAYIVAFCRFIIKKTENVEIKIQSVQSKNYSIPAMKFLRPHLFNLYVCCAF